MGANTNKNELNRFLIVKQIMKNLFLLLALFITLQSFGQILESFEFEGIERTYILHTPPNYDEQTPHSLVINMHGLGSNAAQQQFYSEFNKVADTAQIIVAYPNGVDNQWNVYSDNGIN